MTLDQGYASRDDVMKKTVDCNLQAYGNMGIYVVCKFTIKLLGYHTCENSVSPVDGNDIEDFGPRTVIQMHY